MADTEQEIADKIAAKKAANKGADPAVTKTVPEVPVAKAAKSKEVLKIHIKVYSPFKTYFDEDAYSISAVNGTGPFDILPHHHNFMTLLSPCELIIRRPIGDPIRIRIARGVMHVKADRVVVFLDV